MPNQNQRSADRRYALHDHTETPAASWPIQMVRTCGTVIGSVKTDMPPTSRRSMLSERLRAIAVGVESGAIVISWLERPAYGPRGNIFRIFKVTRLSLLMWPPSPALIHASARTRLRYGVAQT